MGTGMNSFLLSKISNTIWCVEPSVLTVLQNVLEFKFNNIAPLLKVAEGSPRVKHEQTRVFGSKAVISIKGLLMDNASYVDTACGMVPYCDFGDAIEQCNNDPSIDHVILEIDSPGGMASGMQQQTKAIRRLKESKRVTTLVVGSCCSAAYYLGSAADEVYADDPLRRIGSIGAYILHIDQSEKDKKDGLKFTYIKAGEFKTDGNPHEPLNKSAMDYLQEGINECYAQFIGDVAINRGLGVDQVKSMAEGRVYSAAKAPKTMLDGFATLNEILTW